MDNRVLGVIAITALVFVIASILFSLLDAHYAKKAVVEILQEEEDWYKKHAFCKTCGGVKGWVPDEDLIGYDEADGRKFIVIEWKCTEDPSHTFGARSRRSYYIE
jgi:hypothetical protein